MKSENEKKSREKMNEEIQLKVKDTMVTNRYKDARKKQVKIMVGQVRTYNDLQ